MATSYPTSLDAFTNPDATNLTTSPSHSGQHTNVNDSISAVEAYLGTNASQTTPTGTNRVLTSSSATASTWSSSPTLTALTLTQTAATSGSPTFFTATGAAHTTLAASTEAVDCNFNLSRTVQFATGGLTTQRAFLVRAPTYGFVGASTITNAATFAISGAPAAGTNATITNPFALWVQAGMSRFDGQIRVNNSAATVGIFVTSSGNVNAFQVDAHGPTTASALQFNSNSIDGSGAGGDAYALQSNITAAGGVAFFYRNVASPVQPILTLNENNASATQDLFNARVGGVNVFGISRRGEQTITQDVATSGSPSIVTLTGAAHTTLAASTEATDVNINLARTVQFATGALTTQRAMRIQGTTYGFVGASTITNAVTLEIAPPVAGTNATITNPVALATTGGRVGIGTISPAVAFDILQGVAGTLTSRIRNSNTAAADNAALAIDVGETTAGDPSVQFTVNNGNQFYIGIDNSDSDKLEIGSGTTVGTTVALTIPTTREVLINTVTVTGSGKLQVVGPDDGVAGMFQINAAQASVTALDTFIEFRSTTGVEGSVAGTATAGLIAYNTFTGSHWSQSEELNEMTAPGTVLISTSTPAHWDGEATHHLPKCAIVQRAEDKAVYGVFGGIDRDGDVIVLGLGAGVVLVCDEGGPIEVGDFLCSANIPGHAKRYDGNDMRVVLGKARESFNGKMGCIACTYLCG